MDEQQRHTAAPTAPHRQAMPLANFDHCRRDDFSRENHAPWLHDSRITRYDEYRPSACRFLVSVVGHDATLIATGQGLLVGGLVAIPVKW
ncbi:hypothetical protein O1R50_23505 [Glycomyces luteolus]|uniref:Uncharacterized protein n=1 Tax=Glycomyces luteolus TaxID=2670330 RepID=A0A9X3SVL0_9ACTN|nr:hypothetical protein [Glycomyces luteolus]MDA1362608.1 hypothetical protein [Glycomyces luteolus]